jgi:hypothetical protein
MNGDQPKIEIFEPFGAAFELMKRILFQPFDFAKWCVLGFAAFLSGGWGPSFRFNYSPGKDWSFRSTSHGDWKMHDWMPWLIPVLVALGVFILVLVVVLMWLNARGRFIFTDCVVRNRAAIALPWREYGREGNSYFLFSLVVALLALFFVAGVIFVIVLPLGLIAGWKNGHGFGVLTVLSIIFVGLLWVGFGIFFALVSSFMVPVMYRRRCLAREAFVEVLRLVLARPGPFILYVLFGIVLFLAFLFVGTIVTCLTCCIAGLPYISSVVFLPALIWLLAFKLLFLRQFGSEYDVWATVEALEPPAQPPPPSETSPPPPSVPPLQSE